MEILCDEELSLDFDGRSSCEGKKMVKLFSRESRLSLGDVTWN